MTFTFKIGTFNLYNLALPNHSFYRRLEYSTEDYAKKKRWIAQQLERMQTDIVGFQEVIHAQAFDELLNETEGYEHYYRVIAEMDGTHPTVALASKFPITKLDIIRKFPKQASFKVQTVEIPFETFSKPILVAQLALTPNLITTIVVVHLKSKSPIFPKKVDPNDPVEIAKGQGRALVLRTAEAIALRIFLIKLLQDTDHPVIVLGDVNDGGLAFTSQIITGDPPQQWETLSKKKKVWDVLLYSAKEIQDKQSKGNFPYTHIHNGYYENLDHILVSQEWVKQNPRRIGQVKYVTVFNDHLIDDTLCDENLPSWKSDHGQVVATIKVEDEK
ncbi:MAG: endonuclease/exonuclease/phosphatase family protein [Microcystaceae cyanobacterium]